MGDAGLPGARPTSHFIRSVHRERGQFLALPLAALADWLSHATGRRQRRRWVGNGRTHIEVLGLVGLADAVRPGFACSPA